MPPIGRFVISGPSSTTVKQGQSASIRLSLTAASRWQKFTTYSIHGLPSGIQASFNPYGCKPSCGTDLTLACSSNVAVGAYAVTINAATNRWSSSMSMFVNVAQMEPTQPPPSEEPFTADVWVAKTGHDTNNDGLSEGAPKLTIAAGLVVLLAQGGGKRMAIKEGTYTEVINCNTHVLPNGTSFNAATEIVGYPGHTVTLNGTSSAVLNLATGGGAGQTEVAYIIFDNLHLDGSGTDSVVSGFGNSHHVRLTNLEIFGAIGNKSGVLVTEDASGGSWEILNCHIHNNGDDTDGGGSGNVGHGLYIQTNNNLIEGNNIHNNGHYSVQFFPAPTGNIFRRNLCHDDVQGAGLGGGGPTSHGTTLLYSNIVYNEDVGMAFAGSNNECYNNTIHDCNEGIRVAVGSGHNTRNNIIYSCPDPIVTGGTGLTFDQNLSDIADTGIEIVDDPDFVDPVTTHNYHLQSTSPARDTGVTIASVDVDYDNLSRPQGAAYCIGALEFV